MFQFVHSKDSNLTTVVVHSNEDISTATTAHDPCPAPDDGNVTESKTEVETKRVPTSGLPFKIDILSDTTTKRDELNNNEGNHMKKIANKILLSLSFSFKDFEIFSIHRHNDINDTINQRLRK
ncbi:uncharacterized protein RHO17_014855 [Thomomys bottae]